LEQLRQELVNETRIVKALKTYFVLGAAPDGQHLSATDVDTGVNRVTTRRRLEGTLFLRVMLSSNHDPRHTIAAAQPLPVDRLQRYVASRLSQYDSKIAITSRTAPA
jgi:hypothetical protein